jgi:hypothetical protein
MSSLHVSAFANRARSAGLSLPMLHGGGVALPGSPDLRRHAHTIHGANSLARMRQMESALRAGRMGVGSRRLDSASATLDDDVRAAAYALDWADFMHYKTGGQGQATGARLDALVPMASQALTSFIPEIYNIDHSGLVAWNGDILKVGDGGVDPAAEDYVWYERDILTSVRAASTYSTMDIPMVAGPEAAANHGTIIPFLLGMETNFMDDRRSSLSSKNRKPDFQIEQAKAEGCQVGLAQAANGLWLYGDPVLGINGFHNHPAVATISLTGGAWSGKTAAQINSDLVQILNTIQNDAQGGKFTDMKKIRILLPPLQYQRAKSLINSSAGSESVLSYFLKTQGLRDDQVSQVYDFQASNSAIYEGGPLGLTVDTGAVIYNVGDRWDPMFLMPQKIEMPAPPRQNGLSETTFYHMRVGGALVSDARRMRYIVGM